MAKDKKLDYDKMSPEQKRQALEFFASRRPLTAKQCRRAEWFVNESGKVTGTTYGTSSISSLLSF